MPTHFLLRGNLAKKPQNDICFKITHFTINAFEGEKTCRSKQGCR